MKRLILCLAVTVIATILFGCSQKEEEIKVEPEKEYSIAQLIEMMYADEVYSFENIASSLDASDIEIAAEEVVEVGENEFIRREPDKEVVSIRQQIWDMNAETALRVYPLKDKDLVACYERDGNLSANLSDDFFIQINLFFERAGVQFKRNSDGIWRKSAVLSGLGIPHEDPDTTVPLTEIQMRDRVAEEVKTVADLRCIDIPEHSMKLIYFRTGKEYAIPISANPEETGLENGKAYEVSQVMEALAAKIKGDMLNNDTDV